MKFLIYLSTLLLLSSTQAFSCDCLPNSSVREAKSSSTNIFSGVVTEKIKYQIEGASNPISELLISLRIHQIWKGKKQEYIKIRVPSTKEGCGLEFEVGKKYLVYAVGGKTPICHRCTRTKPHFERQAQSDIQSLGEPSHIIVNKN